MYIHYQKYTCLCVCVLHLFYYYSVYAPVLLVHIVGWHVAAGDVLRDEREAEQPKA